MANLCITRCPQCGCRIRGANHTNGLHHKRDKSVVTGAKVARKDRAARMQGLKRNIGDLGDYVKLNHKLPPGF